MRVWRYGVALIAVVLAMAGRALLTPELHSEALFLYFIPPILGASAIGGLGPGLLSTVLSLAVALILLDDGSGLSKSDTFSALAFAVIGGATAWGPAAMASRSSMSDALTRASWRVRPAGG